MTYGLPPRTLGWAQLRLSLAGYRFVREIGRATGLTAALIWSLDRLSAMMAPKREDAA